MKIWNFSTQPRLPGPKDLFFEYFFNLFYILYQKSRNLVRKKT
jgi:hypothetical protein